MKMTMFRGKSKRTKLFSAITAILLVAVIGLNFLFYSAALDNTVFFDMTKEELYTVSDLMEEECRSIFDSLKDRDDKKKVKITFCTDRDYIMQSQKMRISYVMAIKLANMFPDYVEMETVNAALNPTAVAQYKTTSLSKINPTDIIFSYGTRYRIVNGESFWLSGTNNDSYYNGEYRVATLIRSVTAISQPAAYFVTGHGETVYDPENPESESSLKTANLANLLYERGLQIKLLDLSDTGADRVPDDCALLIINNPRSDFLADSNKLDQLSYVSETEKLDRYLVVKQGAIMVATDYAADWDNMKNFKNFLYEWGIEIGDTLVKDKESSLSDAENSETKIVAEYNTSEESFGYAIYSEFATLSSAPLTVFENTGIIKCAFGAATDMNEPGANNINRNYVPFMTSSKTAELYYKNAAGEYVEKAGNAGVYDLAALSVRSELDSKTGEKKFSYMFCVNSPDFLSGDLLGEASYANFDILSAVINNISRVDEHASTNLGGTSLNSLSMGGKKIIPTTMSTEDVTINSNKYVNDDNAQGLILIKQNRGISTGVIVAITIIVSVIPLAVATVGIIVGIKRRHL